MSGPLTRRTMLAGLGASLVPVPAAMASAAAPTVKTFDPGAIIDHADAMGLYSLIITKDGEHIQYGLWFPGNCEYDPDSARRDAYIAEMHRRDRVYPAQPGETANEADRRISAMLKYEREGPLLADDVTGTTAFADWETRTRLKRWQAIVKSGAA